MPDDQPPSALPSRRARALAFLAIVVAGACGALIGWAVVDLQCGGSERAPAAAAKAGSDGGCGVAAGVGAMVGGVAAAGGVAVVAVLVLRAVGEAGRRGIGPPPPFPPAGPAR